MRSNQWEITCIHEKEVPRKFWKREKFVAEVWSHSLQVRAYATGTRVGTLTPKLQMLLNFGI